jgi:hypothetical protein
MRCAMQKHHGVGLKLQKHLNGNSGGFPFRKYFVHALSKFIFKYIFSTSVKYRIFITFSLLERNLTLWQGKSYS